MPGYPVLGVGIDEAWDRATPAQIRAYGASFVARYLGEDRTGKNLTRAEAEQLSAAGLAIVSNYEYNPGDALRGYDRGRAAAQLAAAQHAACGGPADRPIYFSVDVDVVDPHTVAWYFRGIGDQIGLPRAGAYGEYDVIAWLFDQGLIRWGWQTYAWSHGAWDARAQLRQVANGVHLAGHDVDRNEAHAPDFGQWRIGGPVTDLDTAFPAAPSVLDAGGKPLQRTLATDIREAGSVLLDGVTVGGDRPAGFGVLADMVADRIEARVTAQLADAFVAEILRRVGADPGLAGGSVAGASGITAP